MSSTKLNPYLLSFIMLVVSFPSISNCTIADGINVSSPLYTDSAGFVGKKAASTVFRILCPSKDRMGTGFLHKSGRILTAAHVVDECPAADVIILLPQGTKVGVTDIVKDDNVDVAALTPIQKINGDPIPVANTTDFKIGSQVSTWGFPGGYTGKYPMLSVGYLSGVDAIQSKSGILVGRLVVNAAFNSGNSGGPLIDIESGSVMGIVSSKLAVFPPNVQKGLEALKNTEFGVTWDITKADGTKGKISQSQLLEYILQYLRQQTQLVVGRAVMPDQLNKFLTDNGLR